jgi:Holliday junction resolvase RusA-like endonuclease
MQDTNTLTIEKIGTIVIPGHVPSINDYIHANNIHRMKSANFEREWRVVGLLAAQQWILGNGDYFFEPLKSGIWLNVRVYRKDNIRRDVHNLYIKPILDGFVQGGLLTDDNEKVVHKVTLEYCGVDRNNPRVEFEIYQEMEGSYGKEPTIAK